MTSTSFNVGLRDGQRLSSRVLRPPGGGHTQLFGDTEELQNQKECIPETVAEKQQEELPITEVNGAPKSEAKEDKIEQEAPPVEEVKEEQVVTPKAAPAAVPEPAPAPRPPQRARVPPGGYSSGLW